MNDGPVSTPAKEINDPRSDDMLAAAGVILLLR